MMRTNVVIDNDVLDQVMDRFGLKTKREAVNFALHAVLGDDKVSDPWKGMLELEGLWADMTDEEAGQIWGSEVPDGPNAERPGKPR